MSGVNPLDILASLGNPLDEEPEAEGTATSENSVEESVESAEESSNDDQPSGSAGSDGIVPDPDPPVVYGKGRFKTAEELDKAYDHAERRMQEEIRQRQQLEQRLAAIEAERVRSQSEAEAALFDPGTPKNLEELVEYTYHDPTAAFWFAAEKAPKAVGRVLAEIRQFDPAQAENLILEHQQWQTEYAMEQMQQQAQSIREEALRPVKYSEAERTAQQAHRVISGLPNYDRVKDAMAEIIKSRPNLISMDSADSLTESLKDVYEIAMARNQNKLVNSTKVREQAAGDAGVETGSFNSTTEIVDENPTEMFRNNILKAANRVSW